MNVQVLRILSLLVVGLAVSAGAFAQDDGASGSVRISDQPTNGGGLPPAAGTATVTDPSFPSAMPSYGEMVMPSQSGYYRATQPYQPTEPDGIFTPMGRVDARGGQLYGYDEGYTNVGAYVPYFVDRDTVLFADVRGMMTNQGKGGANVGLGWRGYFSDYDRVLGASFWYDYDNGHINPYNQLGVSLESLGRYIDFRINGYVPVSAETNTVGSYIFGNAQFVQSRILLNRATEVEYAYSGFDAETGGPLPVLGRYGMSGYVGFYYFTGDNSSDFTGVSGRIQAQLNEDLALNVQMTDDHRFGTNAQIQVAVTLPDGWPTRWLRPLKVRDRLTERVIRNYRVIAGTEETYSTEDAINPVDGLPYFVAHVNPNVSDPTAGDTGDGTIENPFNTINGFNSLAPGVKGQYDIVYVTNFGPTSSSLGLATGVQLMDTQRLLSTAVQHQLRTTAGTFLLPGYEGSGAPLPILQNLTGGPVVTLADSNEVAGFIIDGTLSEDTNGNGVLDPGEDLNGNTTIDNFDRPFNNGIVSQVGGIERQADLPIFNINRNTIRNVQNGVLLETFDNEDATGALVMNTITGTGFDSIYGASIRHVGPGTLNVLVSQNTVTGFRGEDRDQDGILRLVTEDTNGNGFLDAGEDTNGNGILDLAEDINGNGTLDDGVGIRLVADGGDIEARTFTDASGTVLNSEDTNFDGVLIASEDANGNGVLDVSEDTNGNGILDPTEDTNGNGVLDPTEDTNGNGTLDPGEDTNANGSLDLAEDTNGNGILDVSEDTNGNGSLDLAEDTNGNGLLDRGEDLNSNGIIDDLAPGIDSNVATGNGTGIQLIATGGATFAARVTNNDMSGNLSTVGAGFEAIADNGTMLLPAYLNNDTSGNAGDGTRMIARNGGTLNVDDTVSTTIGSLIGNNFNDNDGDGLLFFADGGTILIEGISGLEISGNGDDGLELRTDNGGTLTVDSNTTIPEAQGAIGNNIFSNNDGSGLHLAALGGTLTAAVGSPVTVTPPFTNEVTDNGENGLLLETATGGTLNTVVNGVLATGNDAAGIALNLDGGTMNFDNTGLDPLLSNGIVRNQMNDNGTNGMDIINGNGGVVNLPRIQFNDFDDNNRSGLFFGGDDADGPLSFNNIGQIADNSFNRTSRAVTADGGRGTMGIEFDTLNVTTWAGPGVDVAVLRNSFIGRTPDLTATPIDPGASQGIGGVVENGGLLMSVGDGTTANASTFLNNGDAHIGLQFEGDSINNFEVDGLTLSNAFNLTGTPDYLGDGIVLNLRDTAVLTGYVQRSTITNNANDGVRVNVTGVDLVNLAQVNNFRVGGLLPSLGNDISNNGGDGVHFVRTGSGQVNNALIANNLLDTNGENGIRIEAFGANAIDTYLVTRNTITNNGFQALTDLDGNGIALRVGADADIDIDIDLNEITDNAIDGIRTSELVTAPTDSRSIDGNWTRNLIAGNGDDGIDLNAAMDGVVIGDALDPALGNLIEDNAGSGIEVNAATGAGSLTIGNNIIRFNGTLADLFTIDQDSGIDINGVSVSDYIIVNNLITENFGDGIEMNNAIQNGSTITATITGNEISYNRGRGFDLLNQVNSFMNIHFDDNVVSNNRLEGVYIVNTASATQNQFDPSSTPLAADGGIFTSAILEFFADGNTIVNNGIDSTLNATGLVVRVGTQDSFGGINNPLLFGNPFASDATFTDFSTTFLGGVTMAFNNNQLGGNRGRDIWFHSFVSTAGSGDTGGAWSDTEFDPAGYDADPLARFDLQFLGNTFASSDVNNSFGVASANPALVAFYDNADGVWKSRLNNATPPGPFTAANRRRNAQRLQADLPFLNAPVAGSGANFNYPGTGQSTFRAQTDEVGLFLFDNAPYNDTFDANGFIIPGANSNGELGYGWTELP